MNTRSSDKCPRCGEGQLRGWNELNEEERIVVRRLPAFAGYSMNDRERMHRWCSRCWYEETQNAIQDA